jgi:hypothetical protein
MICTACKGARHTSCLNEGKDTTTWCDCQHKIPGANDVVLSWVTGEDGITRRVVNGHVEELYRVDVQADLGGVRAGAPSVEVRGEAPDPQEMEGARL